MTEENGGDKYIMCDLPTEILYTINEFRYGDKQYNRKILTVLLMNLMIILKYQILIILII